MIVGMWMTRDLVTIGLDTPIAEAAALMSQNHIRRLPVVEAHAQGLHLLGIITAKDILHAFPSGVNPFAVIAPDARATPIRASEIMSRYLQTTAPETPIEEAARLMTENKIGSLPVLREKRLVPRTVHPIERPARTASSMACRFGTGSAPGMPRHTGHTFVFGGAPNDVEHPQNILVRVASCACTSRPITASY